MSVNLSDKIGRGLSPEQFMEGMERNKEAFRDWYEQFSWQNEEDKEFFSSLRFRDDLRCLIIAAEWCGDVVRNVPAVMRILEETEMPVEVLILEEHTDVIDQFLTMGGRAIPKVVFIDTGGLVLGDWGPRPAHVQEVMVAFKAENPDREAPDYQDKIKIARQEMGQRYGEGTGYQSVIAQELREILSKF